MGERSSHDRDPLRYWNSLVSNSVEALLYSEYDRLNSKFGKIATEPGYSPSPNLAVWWKIDCNYQDFQKADAPLVSWAGVNCRASTAIRL
jgi:hypothetical protein